MRGQDNIEYETDQEALGRDLHTPYQLRKPKSSVFVTILGNPTITRVQAEGYPPRWRVDVRLRFHGGESVYTEWHPKLQRAQESVRQITLNADRIEQEWDQVQPGRLSQ